LEAAVGYPLFVRQPRKMIPTERGKALYQSIRNSIADLEEVERSFSKGSSERRTLSIGMFQGLYEQILEHHLTEMNFNIIMHCGTTDRLIDQLAAGEIDVAVTAAEVHLPNVECLPLGESEFVLVTGHKGTAESFAQLDLNAKSTVREWLSQQVWYDSTDRNNLNQFWKLNFHRTPDFYPNYIVPNNFSVLHCLQHGQGVALLPYSICREALQEKRIVLLWKGYSLLRNKICFAYRKSLVIETEVRQLCDIARQEFMTSHREMPA
jgi:DNA-binding transcriptional LysR family regulator